MKLFFVLIQLCFLTLYCECDVSGDQDKPDYRTTTDSYLHSGQIIRKHGYTAESHFIITADGYILELHHIPSGKCRRPCFPASKKYPVLLHHGMLGTSSDYLLIGNNSLPFLLSDLGFDVWFGNLRGNLYSRSHVTLYPDERKFWNFSWHESAVYDLPAEIDFILNVTQKEKVIYVGLSMGTTILLALTSTLPEYNHKIAVASLMAPVAYVKHLWSPLFRFLAPISCEVDKIAYLLGTGELLPDSKLIRYVGKFFCEKTQVNAKLCMKAIFLVVGSDPDGFDKNLLPVILNHYPAGSSFKAANHYAQLINSGEFRQYDYGTKGNLAEYGSKTPPNYRLDLITTPIYLYMGLNDPLATVPDVKHLSQQLSSLKALRVIKNPKFTHLDFVFSTEAKKLVYKGLISDIMDTINEKIVK